MESAIRATVACRGRFETRPIKHQRLAHSVGAVTAGAYRGSALTNGRRAA
jgi:hypothetical protein